MGVTRTLAELVLLVALVAAAWLIAVGNSRMLPPVTSQPAPGAAFDARPVDAGLPERARALRARLASPPAPSPVARNPFGFGDESGSRAEARADGRPLASASAAAGDATPVPDMQLQGIAEDAGNGHPVRTAVIAAGGELILAKEGDRILSRFLVIRITEDAVHLRDDEGGATVSLVLK